MDAIFFASPDEFRAWLEQNHEQAREVWVGFYKKKAPQQGITYAEAVDEALCYGWIDSVQKGIDDISYRLRFTPRKPGSVWSNVNINKVHQLVEQGRMMPAGIKAFEARRADESGIYAFEQEQFPELGEAYEQQFRANAPAWDFFQSQTASYRKAAIWWVISAKKEETRQRRLTSLIADSEQGKTLAQFTRPAKPK